MEPAWSSSRVGSSSLDLWFTSGHRDKLQDAGGWDGTHTPTWRGQDFGCRDVLCQCVTSAPWVEHLHFHHGGMVQLMREMYLTYVKMYRVLLKQNLALPGETVELGPSCHPDPP